MIKIILKALIAVVVVIGLINYVSYLKTGKSILNFNKIPVPEISFDASDIKQFVPSISKSKAEQGDLYKWVDSNGVTQYTQKPPAEHIKFDIISVNPKANILPEVQTPADENSTDSKREQFTGLSKTPNNIEQLIEDAKNVQEVLGNRAAQQEKEINSH